jgi:hypothetical protein
MDSPSESLTGSQIAQVKQELADNSSLWGIHSSIHYPPNRMDEDNAPPPWPSVVHSRHVTPATSFTNLPSHFPPTADLPQFMARIGGNNEDDGPAPLDHTASAEPDPNNASHLITNTVREQIHKQLNPIMAQLNALTKLVEKLLTTPTPGPAKSDIPPPAVPQAMPPPGLH